MDFRPGVTIEMLEREAIEAALKFYEGNKTKAAQSLGITVRTIQNKLSLYNPKEKNESSKESKSDT